MPLHTRYIVNQYDRYSVVCIFDLQTKRPNKGDALKSFNTIMFISYETFGVIPALAWPKNPDHDRQFFAFEGLRCKFQASYPPSAQLTSAASSFSSPLLSHFFVSLHCSSSPLFQSHLECNFPDNNAWSSPSEICTAHTSKTLVN